jgi:diguanylate cyclase (GGDEF)-like protein
LIIRCLFAVVVVALLAAAGAARADAAPLALQRLPAGLALADGDLVVAGAYDADAQPVDGALLGPDRTTGRWWRIAPVTAWRAPEAPLLAFYAPYANRIVVGAPPHYRPLPYALRDPALDPRWSRHAFVVPLPAGWSARAPVYVYVEAGRRFPMRVALEHPAEFAAGDLAHVRRLTVLLTALGVMAVVVAFFAIVLREVDFALLAGALLFQLLFQLLVTGEAYALPLLRELGAYGLKPLWLARALGSACLFAFLARFLALARHAPRIERVVRGAAYAFVLVAALALLPGEATRGWLPLAGNLLLFGTALVVVGATLVALRRGSRAARFVLVAWLPTLVLDMAREAQLLGSTLLLPPNEYASPTAMAFAGLMFSLGLADRLLAVRRERDAARRDAERDALTGALNRGALAERLAAAVDSAAAEGRALALLFLDLDRFKQINDAHGHRVGDACLLAVVDEIGAELRRDDSLGRYGGEEFVVVLPGASAADAKAVAERIRERVRRRCVAIDERAVGLTVSIGVAEFGPDGASAEELLAHTDAALYAAKAAGRDRVETRARAA